MPPTIRYCPTQAGRVAYSTAGSGPPLFLDSGWVTHLHRQLDLFSFRAFHSRLAERFTVVRYDKPGCGLSERDGADLSFEAQVTAAMAVADALRLSRFAMFGASQGGHIAAAIAARHPDRITSLVLYGTCADGAELAPKEVRESLVSLVRAHWGLGSRMMTTIFVPEPTAAEQETFTRLQREGATAAVASELLRIYYETDVTGLLPRIRARTAVLHREADTAARFQLGQKVARLVPDAGLVPLPGSGHLFYQGEWEAVLDAAMGFLTGGPETSPVLTGREIQVAKLVAEGLTNHAIATRLSVAPRTAETHVENIRRKLQVRSRAQIAAWVSGQAGR